MTNIVVPSVGESVSSATVARWLKKTGDAVAADEPLVELETDKVTVEVNAPVPPLRSLLPRLPLRPSLLRRLLRRRLPLRPMRHCRRLRR